MYVDILVIQTIRVFHLSGMAYCDQAGYQPLIN